MSASRVVARRHAVAALSPIPGLSSTLGWFAVAILGWAGVVIAAVAGLERATGFLLLVPVASVLTLVAMARTVRRLSAWWRWRDHRGAVELSDLGADPQGEGFGGLLLDDLVATADNEDRTLVLRADPANTVAARLYASRRFLQYGPATRHRARMVRHPATPRNGRVEESTARRRRRAGLLPTAAAVVAAVLTVLFWSAPVVVLMPVTGVLVVAAAAFDVRWRRVPNLLTAGAATVMLMLVVLAELAFDRTMLPAAAAGAAILASPLLVSHLITRARTPGLGDVKLAAVLGLVCGAVHLGAAYLGLLVALLIGVPFGLVWRLSGRGRAFPFAPALGAATVAVLATWRLMDGPTTW